MRIGLKVTMWKRPEVFEIFAEGAHRLRKNFGIQVFVAGSEGEISRKLCEKWGFEYLETPNEPMGTKLNMILKYMQSFDLDYIINLGSDDLINDNVIKAYLPYMEQRYDVLGVYGIYTFDLLTKKALYLHKYKKQGGHGEFMGAGRAISRKVLDHYDWELWDNEQSFGTLDRAVTNKLQKFDKTKAFFLTDINGVVIDLKSSFNIHPFNYLQTAQKVYSHRKFVNPIILKNKLPEYNLLMSYKEVK